MQKKLLIGLGIIIFMIICAFAAARINKIRVVNAMKEEVQSVANAAQLVQKNDEFESYGDPSCVSVCYGVTAEYLKQNQELADLRDELSPRTAISNEGTLPSFSYSQNNCTIIVSMSVDSFRVSCLKKDSFIGI